MSLENKVVVVTGSSGGIGIATASALAAEGAIVVLTDIYPESLAKAKTRLETKGFTVHSAEMDVTSIKSIEETLSQVVQKFGHLDVLVNNAGVCKIRPALEITSEDWDLVLNINLKGLFFCSQIAARHMMKQKSGNIINIASNAGKVGFPDQADYNASKAGVINLTRSLAEEWAQYGINVNAICPGAVRTSMLTGIADLIANKTHADAEELLNSFAPRQLGRLISPDEIGKLVAFLASEQAAIIRGQSINVDAGSTPY